jgi:general secretion pathway protein L
MTSATFNWRQRVRESANRAGLPRFWRWWMGELGPLLPRASRAALQRRFARPVIELADGQAVFWRPEVSNGVARLAITESVALGGDSAAVLASGRAAVTRLAASASAGIAAPKVIVALSPRQVLRKELTLPAAVEENLAQTLAYDLDRHTPFRAEQLYFDATIAARDPVKKTLRVDWAAALKTIVDAARKQVEDWGAVPVAVVPGPPTTSTRLNLLPSAARPRQLQWRRWQLWVPLAAIVLLVAAAVFVPLLQKRQYAVTLAEINAEAAQQAQMADKLRQQLERVEAEYNYILAKKYAYPSAVHVLDEVTRVLPDDTWITQLELKSGGRGKDAQRDLYLRGESANAGKLISLLEDSKLVELVAPRSPTTKIQGSSGEIFDLGARVRALPATTPVALAALPPVPVASPAPTVPALPTTAATATPSTTTPATVQTPPAAAAAVARSVPPPAPALAPAPNPTLPPVLPPVQSGVGTGFGPFPPGVAPPAAPSNPSRAARAARSVQPPVPVAPPAAQQTAPPAGALPAPPPVPAQAAPEPSDTPAQEGEPKTEED